MSKKKVFLAIVLTVAWIVAMYFVYQLGRESMNEGIRDVEFLEYVGYEIYLDGEILEDDFQASDLMGEKWYIEKEDKEEKVLYLTKEKK